MGMFGYMTDTETVEPIDTVEVESEGKTPWSIQSITDHSSNTCYLLYRRRPGVAALPFPR